MKISRRNLLALIGVMLLPSCSQDEQARIDPHLAKLLNELSLRKWSVQVGRELHGATPEKYSSATVNELFDKHFSLPKFGNVDEFKKAVYTRIMNDFRDDRITTYQGWIFSQKESVLYVLAFLFTTKGVGIS